MASLNKCMIIGNVGRDPDMRFTPSGNPVTTFSVAVNNRWEDQSGQKQEETEWFSVVCWDRVAESTNQYLVKGMSVYVEGRMKTRSWEGTDGQKHYRTELIAQRVQFLTRKEDGPGDAGHEEDLGPDDIPF